jgi:DNA-binding MarR family transcriptional regulator
MMIKPLDHIGMALWRAAENWQIRFAEEMALRGYPWHQEARGEVLAHLGPSGRTQAEITAAMRVSKQAVQQLVDQLEADGVVRRAPDPNDGRGRRIELTPLGLRDYAERRRVKRAIEREYEQRLGTERLQTLRGALDALIAEPE